MKTFTAALTTLALTLSCAGRGANPVTVSRATDKLLSCEGIVHEQDNMENQIRKSRHERASVSDHNTRMLVGSLIILPIFAMDVRTGSAIKKENEARRERIQALDRLYNTRGCVMAKQEDGADTKELLDIERDERRHGELIDAIRDQD